MTIISPDSVAVPTGISIHALQLPGGPNGRDGVGPISLRDVLIIFSLHSILSRESSAAMGFGQIAQGAVLAADAVLAARSTPPAKPTPPAVPVVGDSSPLPKSS